MLHLKIVYHVVRMSINVKTFLILHHAKLDIFSILRHVYNVLKQLLLVQVLT